MARLPTAEALGVVNNAAAGGPMSSIQSGAMAEGVSALARSGQRFGAAMYDIGDRNEAFDTRIATSTATANLLKENNAFEQRMRENPDNWQNYEKEYDEHIAQAKQRSAALITDPRQRQLWEAQNQSTIENWRQRVKSTARSRHNDAFLGQTQTDVNELRNLALNPNTPEEERALHIETAGAMIEDARRRGVINDTQAAEWSSKWREGYAVKRVEMMPAKERAVALAAAQRGASVSGDENKALEFFVSRGLTKEQAAGIVGNLIQESSLRTGARNPGDGRDGTDSIGIGQWNSSRARMLQQFAASRGKPVTDFDTQLEFVWQEMNSTESRAFQRLKQAKTVDEATAAFIGYERPQGWSENNPRAGHGWGNRLSHAARLAGKYQPGVAEIIPPDQRERLLTRANAEVEREAESEKFNVRRLVADDTSGLLAVGRGVEGLSYDRVKDALGKDEADKWQASRTIAQKTFENTRGMEDMTDAQLVAHSEKFRPGETDAGEGFSDKAQIYQNVQTKAQEIITKRASDPAQSVDNSEPVRKARQAAAAENTLANREAVIAARLQQQELFGVPAYNRSPITIEEAKSYAAKMRPLARGQADVANQAQVIEGIVNEIEQQYGKYAKEVLQRVLYHVTLKRDASEVLARAVNSMQTEDSGPIFKTEDNRRLEQGEQARSIAAMGGIVNPYRPDDPTTIDPRRVPEGVEYEAIDPVTGEFTERKYSQPPLKAVQLLESDPQKYMPFFIQKYGVKHLPRSLTMGPYEDQASPVTRKAKK